MSITHSAHYHPIAKWLHWLIAALIVLQYILAELAENAADAENLIQQLALLANHKSIGITVLGLAVVRILWRLTHQPPELPATMIKWQITASRLTHWALYLLIFALPISGWLMSSASAYSVSWFNLITLPDFVAADPILKDTLATVHEGLARALFILALIHILAAIKHALVDKDSVLTRMSSTMPILGGVALLIAGLYVLQPKSANEQNIQETSQPSLDEANATPVQSTPHLSSNLDTWEIDYGNSYIKFTAEQAGANFTGEWRNWQAHIQFEIDHLAQSLATVTIQTDAVDSGDQERDTSIVGTDFFAASEFPDAIFQSLTIQEVNPTESLNEAFQASATLTIKNLTTPIVFYFDYDGESGVLKGRVSLDRLALNVGIGDWSDTSWVGQYVEVEVKVSRM